MKLIIFNKCVTYKGKYLRRMCYVRTGHVVSYTTCVQKKLELLLHYNI
jgi:hypothetical protein